MSESIDHPITFTFGQKIMGLVLVVITATLSTGGGYLSFRSITDNRLFELEKTAIDHNSRISDMEKHGHEDHERRITKLELRVDDIEKRMNEQSITLEHIDTIVQGLDKKIDDLKTKK